MCVSFSFQNFFARAHLWYLNGKIVNCNFNICHCVYFWTFSCALFVCVCVFTDLVYKCNWWSCVSSRRLLKNTLTRHSTFAIVDQQLLFLSFDDSLSLQRSSMRFNINFRSHLRQQQANCGGGDRQWWGFSYPIYDLFLCLLMSMQLVLILGASAFSQGVFHSCEI